MSRTASLIAITYCFVISQAIDYSSATRNFVIDYENDVFLKDGKPFRYISGTVHYFQIPHALWRDRLERARALGVDAVQTYVMWSRHETFEGRYNFENEANITEYLELAKSLSLLVILRIGPYIDAEQDFGGLPYWLLKYPQIALRSSSDKWYQNAVAKWYSILLPKIRPMLYANGGPVIMVQIENEYGSYGCDRNYTLWLQAETMKYLQDNVVYFTTDGYSVKNLQCGQLPDTLTTVDFGAINESSVKSAFANLRSVMAQGPLVNSEFYPGWYDVWGEPSRRFQPSALVTDTMRYMWRLNASFNVYPLHGGTNWGYQGGGECCPFRSVTTGYDFDAPLSESGDVTSKFLDIRHTVEELTGRKTPYRLPSNSTKSAYGPVQVQYLGNVFDLMYSLAPLESVKRSEYPLTMEQLDHPYGYIMYESRLNHDIDEIINAGGFISVQGVHDRAYVMIDHRLVGVIQRSSDKSLSTVRRKILLPPDVASGSPIHILVENQGRVAYGQYLTDIKGLTANVTLGLRDVIITNWTTYPLKLENLFGNGVDRLTTDRKLSLKWLAKRNQNRKRKIVAGGGGYLPSFYLGYLMPDNATDTFFDSTGWGKGQLIVNGVNVGRYWPSAGPQISLYVPGCFLSGFNQIVIFELEKPNKCQEDKFFCSINFTDRPLYKL